MNSEHSFIGFDKDEIASRLRTLRRALGLNQREMAEQFNCAPSRWNNYEKGTSVIQIPEAIGIAQAYGVPLDWVYRGETAMLPVHLAEKIRNVLRDEAAGITEKRTRRKSA